MSVCNNCGQEKPDDSRFCPTCGTQVLSPNGPAPSMIGLTLHEKYRILEELGQGSMGTVYLAEHVRLKKPVAIKVLHSVNRVGEESVQRFQREGIAAGKFQHPGAIQIFDIERLDRDTLYLAMEYAEGVTLGDRLRKDGPMEPADVLELGRQLLEVLAEAHGQGIVHRDLKPDNLMIARHAAGQLSLKVLDFGLSKLMDAPSESSLMTRTGSLLGTPLYMSPEQCNGEEVDHRTDLYAVGLILFEALSGRAAFAGESLGQILYKHTNEPAPSLHEVEGLTIPAGLDAVLRRSMEKTRDGRYQSASEMLADLAQVRLGERDRAGPRSGDSRRSVAVVAGMLFVLVPVVVLAVGFLLLRGGGDSGASGRGSAAAPPTGSAPVPPVLDGDAEGPAAPELGGNGGSGASGAEPDRSSSTDPGPEEGADPLKQEYDELLSTAERRLRGRDTAGAGQAVTRAFLIVEHVDALAYARRGAVFLADKDFELAQRDFEEALSLDAACTDAATGLGRTLLQLGDAGAAAESFQQALDTEPESTAKRVDALVGLAVAMARTRRPEEARVHLERALDLDERNPEAQVELAHLDLDAGDLMNAREHFETAKRHDPAGWRPLMGLGQLYERMGDLSAAEQNYRTAIAKDGAAHLARARLAALLLDDERFVDAERVLVEDGLFASPHSAECCRMLAVIRHAQGNNQEAQSLLTDAIERDRENAGSRMLLGLLHQEAGRDVEAQLQFENVIEIEFFEDERPHTARAEANLGLLALERADVDEAYAYLSSALQLDETVAVAHLGLGILHAEYFIDSDGARRHFQRFLDLGGRNRDAEDYLASH